VVGQKSGGRRWLALTFKLVVIAIVVWFVRRTIADAWRQLGEHPWEFHPEWIALSGVLYLVALFPSAVFWFLSLRSLGQHPHFWESMRAYFIGHLGKYVPGKAMVVVIRAGLIGGHRVDTGVAAASVFLETLTWLAAGSFLAAAYLVATIRHDDVVFWGAVGLMVVTGLPTLPPVFPRLARLAGVGKRDPAIVEKLHRLGYRTMLLGWILMAAGWTFMGLAYWATFRALGLMGIEGIRGFPLYTAAVALAVVAGFLAVFVPAGVGIREAALAKLMIPYLRGIAPQAELVAWTAAMLFRLVSVVSELGISGILYFAGLPKPRPPREEPPSAQNA